MLLFGEIWCPNWLIYVMILLVLTYFHYVYVFNFWKKQGVPGPTPWPIVGTISHFFRGGLMHELEQADFVKYGPVHGKFEFSQKILSINDPELVKQILVKDFEVFRNRRTFDSKDEYFNNSLVFQKDEEWKSARKMLSPVFSAGKLKKMSPLITACSKDVEDLLLEMAENKQSFDAREIFRSFAMNVIGRCIFGIDIDFKDLKSPFMKHAKAITDPDFTFQMLLLFLWPKLGNALNLSFLNKEATNFFLGVVTKVFEERKNKKSDRVDFVQMALELMKEEDISTEDKARSSMKKNVTYKEISAQAIIFILAGIETTLSTLSHMSYNCALHPETQDKLMEEVDAVVKKHGEVNYDAVQEMPYLSAFIDETLRVYPIAHRSDRVCSRDYQLGSVFIPKNSVVSISMYSLHKDPKYWSDPERFNPERFFGEETKNIHPYAYMPFLNGPRNCIAKRFALLEIKLCFASIISKMRFQKSSKTKIPLEFIPSIDTMTAKSVDLAIELRE